MAEGDINFYNHFKEQLLAGAIDLDGDTFKIALSTGYAFNADGEQGYADLTNELSGSGYTAGGETLSSLAVDQDDGNDNAAWDAGNVTWNNLYGAAITAAVIYDDTVTTPVDKLLVCHIEIATASNGANYSVNFHTDGIGELS